MEGGVKYKLGIALLLVAIAAGSFVVARADTSPDEWLQKMSTAVDTLDYEGTVIRGTSTDATAFKGRSQEN